MAQTKSSTYLSVRQKLLDLFQTEEFPLNRLPPENVLAQRLGVSLATLREALMLLAKEGYVTKIHGAGNFVHKSTLNDANRSFLYLESLAAGGHQASCRTLSRHVELPEPETCSVLGLRAGEQVVTFRVLYYQDEIPAIFLISHLPCYRLIRSDYENMEPEHLPEMIRKFCGISLAHALDEYLPGHPTGETAALLRISGSDAIMIHNQVFYSDRDEPVLHSRAFFRPGVYTLHTLQNWALL